MGDTMDCFEKKFTESARWISLTRGNISHLFSTHSWQTIRQVKTILSRMLLLVSQDWTKDLPCLGRNLRPLGHVPAARTCALGLTDGNNFCFHFLLLVAANLQFFWLSLKKIEINQLQKFVTQYYKKNTRVCETQRALRKVIIYWRLFNQATKCVYFLFENRYLSLNGLNQPF